MSEPVENSCVKVVRHFWIGERYRAAIYDDVFWQGRTAVEELPDDVKMMCVALRCDRFVSIPGISPNGLQKSIRQAQGCAGGCTPINLISSPSNNRHC